MLQFRITFENHSRHDYNSLCTPTDTLAKKVAPPVLEGELIPQPCRSTISAVDLFAQYLNSFLKKMLLACDINYLTPLRVQSWHHHEHVTTRMCAFNNGTSKTSQEHSIAIPYITNVVIEAQSSFARLLLSQQRLH